MDDNKPAENNDGDVINVKVTPPQEATETNSEANPLIPTVEAAGDPPADDPQPAPAPEVPAQQTEQPQVNEQHESPAINNDSVPAQVTEHKTSAPVGTIIAAVFVAIVLAAITIYAYMKQNEKEPAANESTTSQTETVQDNPSDDIDQAAAEIDKALEGANEETDFSESELSDQSLGL